MRYDWFYNALLTLITITNVSDQSRKMTVLSQIKVK